MKKVTLVFIFTLILCQSCRAEDFAPKWPGCFSTGNFDYQDDEEGRRHAIVDGLMAWGLTRIDQSPPYFGYCMAKIGNLLHVYPLEHKLLQAADVVLGKAAELMEDIAEEYGEAGAVHAAWEEPFVQVDDNNMFANFPDSVGGIVFYNETDAITPLIKITFIKDNSQIKEIVGLKVIGTYFTPMVKIKMPCGESIEFNSIDEIKEKTIPCTCGDPRHFFIKWEKVEE